MHLQQLGQQKRNKQLFNGIVIVIHYFRKHPVIYETVKFKYDFIYDFKYDLFFLFNHQFKLYGSHFFEAF